ncbi:hypothetical protein NWF32_28725 [Pseudomonas qingdaonensis]|nr:hypothetical protein [Pseudomonas qingdaonensis]
MSEGDYLLKRGYNHSFLGDGLTGPGTWKRLLANEDGMRVTLFCLWNRLDETRPLPAQLQRIIDQARVREPWRQVLIQTPSALGYCALRQLRFERDQVYLLARERMSGSHAELFSFALHQRLQTPQRLAQLAPLSVEGYVPVSAVPTNPTSTCCTGTARRCTPISMSPPRRMASCCRSMSMNCSGATPWPMPCSRTSTLSSRPATCRATAPATRSNSGWSRWPACWRPEARGLPAALQVVG